MIKSFILIFGIVFLLSCKKESYECLRNFTEDKVTCEAVY